MKELTKKQELFWSIMQVNSGVLHLTGKPGISKTSQIETIAKKTGYNYIDLRLSMLDETEVGLYPYRKNINGIETLSYAVPEWAILANQRPTIVNFDEMKRASVSVRNAALQILLERRIGPYFKFNDNVHFVITDNLGDGDGTDVDEFDSALNNRLIHIRFDLSFPEWVEDFAKPKNSEQRICDEIINFLENHTEYFYHKVSNEEAPKAYATPRSWTFLSDWMRSLDKKGLSKEEKLNLISMAAPAYIGTSAIKFVEFLNAYKTLTLEDIYKAKNAAEIKKMLENYNRDKKSEIIKQIKDTETNLYEEPKKHLENVARFIAMCDLDETFDLVFSIMLNNMAKNRFSESASHIINVFKKEFPDWVQDVNKLITDLKSKNANASW